MKTRLTLICVLAWALFPAAAAHADAVHDVAPGESLYSIAAVDGLSVDALAAANGLPVDAGLSVGQVLAIPAQGAIATQTSAQPSTEPVSSDGDSDSDDVASTDSGASAGTTGGTTTTATQPYGGYVSGASIADTAVSEGVSSSLAEAIAWQESGFNNDEVSATGAVGVMQLEPGTVAWINQNLTPAEPINAGDPSDNIRGGVLLLRQLLAQTGGDEAAAVADYYQGAASVATSGMYPSTRQYVNDVLALQGSFGG